MVTPGDKCKNKFGTLKGNFLASSKKNPKILFSNFGENFSW